MVMNSHLVVNFPPNQEGSVLGLIVVKSRLGQILEAVHRVMVLDHTIAEVRAEIAALRAPTREVVTQQDYLAGPEEQIREILLSILNHQPRHEKGDYELRTETFECLYGERGSMDSISVDSMSLLPTVVKPINGLVELHEMREKEDTARNRTQRSRVSMAARLAYEKRLAEHVAEWRKKDYAEQEEARRFQQSAKLYRNFCVKFEFPKTVDKEAMEKATEHLIKTLPSEHLKALMNDVIDRGLVETVFGECVVGDDISYVRQQDIHLASRYAKSKIRRQAE